MTNKIKEILEELYLIDESLKEYQVELEKIIEKLLAAKPKVKINEQFKQELRRELLARIEEIKGQESVSPNKFMNLFNFSKLSYGLVGGALAVVLVIIGGAYYANQKGFLFGQPKLSLGTEFSTTALSDEAFGSLKTETQAGTPEGQLGTGGGGVGGAVAPGTGGGGPGVMPPYVTQYRYLYKGDDLVLEQTQVEVLKREKGKASSGIANLIKNMNFGMVDLSSFSNARLDSVSFIEDNDFGYAVYVNFNEGSISININSHMQGWQEVLGVCFQTGCVRPEPLKESDIPSEEKIIQIADSFIKDYGIKTDNYGQPESKMAFLIEELQRVQRAGGTYTPESIRVIYPLMIQGRPVYDKWGNKFGLDIDINLRAMRVTGLYNLNTQNYQSSMYQAEIDVSKILEIAEKGGLNQYPVYGNVSKTIDLEISAPSLAYMRVWKHNQGQSDEFLTPALVFPIDSSQLEGTYTKENIVVPLAKDLLETAER